MCLLTDVSCLKEKIPKNFEVPAPVFLLGTAPGLITRKYLPAFPSRLNFTSRENGNAGLHSTVYTLVLETAAGAARNKSFARALYT